MTDDVDGPADDRPADLPAADSAAASADNGASDPAADNYTSDRGTESCAADRGATCTAGASSVESSRSSRYRRQQLLDWLDSEAQERLAQSTILIARVGGLGGPLTQSLAMAGIGRIVFYHEGDLLEEDLHRMVLMDTDGVGRPRAPQAEASLRRLGRPGIVVEGFNARITREDADRWLEEADIAIGAAPTYEERLILNDAALAAGKPFVDAAMYAGDTQVFCASPGRSSCLRCIIPEPPPWRHDFPVLAAVSATIGNLAASLIVRILAGDETVPWGEFLYLDTHGLRMERTRVPPRQGCPACEAVPVLR